MEMMMIQTGSLEIGDLVQETLYVDRDKNTDRIGVVIGEFPAQVSGLRMVKVCWSPCISFPVAASGYTCFVNEKHLKVLS